MTTELEALEIKTNEFGEVIDELLDTSIKVYRKNLSGECLSDERMNACVRNWRIAHGLSETLSVGQRNIDKALARCGKEVNANNLETHQTHCPRCAEISVNR